MSKIVRRFFPVLLLSSALFLGAAERPAIQQYCPWGTHMDNTCTAPEAYQPENNGIMRMYNLFPRNYANIDEMTADLPRIREMGFSHVWMNPIHETTEVEKKDWPQGTPNGLKGSIYSMRDPFMIAKDFSVVPEEKRAHMSRDEIWEEDKAALKRFTAKATELGMVPMFDLVLSHLAPDSELAKGTHPKFTGVDTKPWFDRYENGEPKRHGLDQDGNILPGIRYPDKEVWDDVVVLKYDTPAIRSEILENLWKPFVKEYFDMGFTGIRVDSVANNNKEVMQETLGYFSDLHEQRYGHKPHIVGETLGGTFETQGKIRGQATHLYNSSYWMPNLTGPNNTRHADDARGMWAGDDNWLLQEAGRKQDIIYRGEDGKLIEGRKGGTVGYAGSHDELPWIYHFPLVGPRMDPKALDEKLFKAHELDFPLDPKAAIIGLREKVAAVALVSDGGWFMTSFDDRADTTLRSVFDKHKQGEALGDISDLVKDINGILKALPQTQFGSWSKRHFLEGRDNLVIVERHTGFGHEGPNNLVMLNADPDQHVMLTPDEVRHLARVTNRSESAFLAPQGEQGVWYGRDIQPPSRQQMLTQKPNSGFTERVSEARRTQVDNKVQRQ